MTKFIDTFPEAGGWTSAETAFSSPPTQREPETSPAPSDNETITPLIEIDDQTSQKEE